MVTTGNSRLDDMLKVLIGGGMTGELCLTAIWEDASERMFATR